MNFFQQDSILGRSNGILAAVYFMSHFVRYFYFLLFFLLANTAFSNEAFIPDSLERSLEYAKIPTSSVSLIIQPLDGGAPIVNLNPDVSRNPASTIKIVTSYSALSILGPAYRWRTEFYLLGELENGVLKGGLGIKGYGDPYFVIEDFWALLRQLRRKGIQKIEGDLVLDDSFFAKTEEEMGDFDGQPARTYNLLPNALLVNFQSVQFRFNDDSAGNVNLNMYPNLPNLIVNNRLRAINGNCGGYNAGIAIQVANIPERNVVELDGKHPKGCENYTLTRTVLNPESYFYGLFKMLWEEQGGELLGSYRSEILALESSNLKQDAKASEVEAKEDLEKPFFEWQSAPFREVLTSTNKYSNNTMTRHLLLSMAAQEVGIPAKTEDGIDSIKTFLIERGMDVSKLSMVNGSGLSRDTRIDAQLMMDVLMDAYKSPHAAEFISSLPLNGIDGTMRSRLRGDVSEGMAHLKTGRLDDVVALSGVVQADSGKRYAMVFMINHKDVHRGVGVDIGDALVNWLHSYKN